MLLIKKWSCRGPYKVKVASSLLVYLLAAPKSAVAYPLTRSAFHPRFYSTFVMDTKGASPPAASRKRSRDDAQVVSRSCAHCIKRLFRSTFLCSQRGETNEQPVVKEETKRAKKPPRPLNSYLKVVLDDETMDRLHEISVELGKNIQSMSQEHEEAAAAAKHENDAADAPATTRKGKPLKFRWRSRNSLHFTFFFGGEVLCSMPSDELTSWHENVKERLGKSKFFLQSDSVSQSPDISSIVVEPSVDPTTVGPEEVEKEDYWFRIKELSLFPPRRNPYLIVALLEASPAWHALYNDIRNIALNGNSEALKSLAAKDKGGDWIPHITLGNLYGGKKHDKNALRTMLQDYRLNNTSEGEVPAADGDCEIRVKCITMGGPVPQQVDLDWNFQNRQQ
jgi:2'-5' RNA ligase